MYSDLEICLSVAPSATRRSTLSSLPVRRPAPRPLCPFSSRRRPRMRCAVSDGSTTGSPRCTAQTASASSALPMRLVTKPAAPAETASMTASGSSHAVSSSTRMCGSSLLRRVRAMRPLMPGMRRSSTTTSGCSACAFSIASRPSAAIPATSICGWRASPLPSASRTIGKSSTTRTLIIVLTSVISRSIVSGWCEDFSKTFCFLHEKRLSTFPPMFTRVLANGLHLTEHEFDVPLDHERPEGETITVFAREIADPDGRDRPLLLFLQGGPGYEGSRPTRNPSGPGWLDRALEEFRVLVLDQRGTGRSTPVGTLTGRTPQEQADHLTHFRADAIVRDAEHLRAALDVAPWSVLGQSFGGLCVTTYLSLAPEGLREAFITGGVPPLGPRIDDVYRATYARTLERNRRYYERYPEDRPRVEALVERLAAEDVRLAGGDRLTPRRLRQLGMALGMSDGAEHLHYLLELPADSPAFRHDVDAALGFARNPLYALLHEACWADGGATAWSAERALPAAYDEDPALFTGEHVFPWMFEEYGALAPLREAAELLAQREWPRLYDEGTLAANEVPVAAAIYADDMYVERTFSEETGGLIRGLRPWLTSEFEHNGLRVDGDRVLGRLLDLARGRA